MFNSKNIITPANKTESDSTSIVQVIDIPKTDKMVSLALPLNSLNAMDDMAIIKNLPENVQKRIFEKLFLEHEDKTAEDEVDDPQNQKASDVEFDKLCFETMKYEINRIDSFSDKWPLPYINPKELAETGFFYLQSEDKVQCAFCRVLIDDWNVGDKPLREHIKKSPKCPFLVTSNVGNVPVNPNSTTSVKSTKAEHSLSYKPKHPRMADIRNRLSTYRSWPLIMLSSKQLSECGLFYTGVGDVVTCFFCGGSLGNWELNDDPWVEHHKFFPDCGYLGLAQRHRKITTREEQSFPTANKVLVEPTAPKVSLSSSLTNDVLLQACEVFPKSLVQDVVLKRMKMHQRPFTSLQEICEAVLEYKCNDAKNVSSQEKATVKFEAAGLSSAGASSGAVKDVLLCKICMDRERGVVFQPCGHLVSCTTCAQMIFDCPVCRAPITAKVRSFLS